MIHLINELFIADPWPAVYIGNLDAIVMADLHLGVEGVLAEEGLYVPYTLSEATYGLVIETIEDIKPSTVILNGDIKHSFGLLNKAEWLFLKKFFNELVSRKLSIILIRGNHDNYLGVLASKYGIKIHTTLNIGNLSILHGHEDADLELLGKTVIIGHEHPSLSIFDELGVMHKFKCFLWGTTVCNRNLLVLPAVSEYSVGTSIAVDAESKVLSPILMKVDIHGLKPFVIIPGRVVKEFPPIRQLISTKYISL